MCGDWSLLFTLPVICVSLSLSIPSTLSLSLSLVLSLALSYSFEQNVLITAIYHIFPSFLSPPLFRIPVELVSQTLGGAKMECNIDTFTLFKQQVIFT